MTGSWMESSRSWDERAVLLAITDRKLLGGDPLARIRALMDRLGPKVIVQIREKDLEARLLAEWARALLPAARATGARLMINGRADVVRCFAPDIGLHLPEDGLPIEEARRFLPDGTMIGASVHDLQGGQLAIDAGADLLAIAPVFATPSKPRTMSGGAPVLGVQGLAEIVRALRASTARAAHQVELFGLGGIDRSNANAVMSAGVDGVAAIRAAWLSRSER